MPGVSGIGQVAAGADPRADGPRPRPRLGHAFRSSSPTTGGRAINTGEARREPARAVTTGSPTVPVDVATLSGFSYACRPDCGLCCYAEPIVAPAEKDGLLRIVPDAEFVTRGRYEFLRSHPDGGACRLLEANRCRGHPARPSPCREFPLTAHVGARVQVTVVLSCPGVDLSPLHDYAGPERAAPPRGFDAELAALRARVDGRVRRLLDTTARRERRIERVLTAEGRWLGDEEVRRRLRDRVPPPSADDFPVEGPPSRQEGLALLPIFSDRRVGPVALASHAGGWELLELYPTGGVRSSLGVVPPPDRPPALSEDAARTLAGYLRYWLERDVLFGAVHLAMVEDHEGSVLDRIAAELRRIGATAVSRAYVLAALRHGSVDRLSEDDVRQGLRATDQDLLDRGTWGTRL
jgi:Fe-S-cluster containining protein